jgi:hypothetical protein
MPPASDPLALIIGAGGACIGALAMLVWALLLARVSRAESEIKHLTAQLSGPEGMYLKIETIRGRLNTAEGALGGLKAETLSRELFDLATRERDGKLEELKVLTKELDQKVDKIDRTLMTPPVTRSR